MFTLAALAGNIVQHRLTWSFETLKPKLSKISPAAGLRRIFSRQSLANLGKGMVKIVLVGSVLIALMWPERGRLEALTHSDIVENPPLAPAPCMLLLKSTNRSRRSTIRRSLK